MKKINLSMLAMAGLLFAACADKDVIAESGPQKGEITPSGYMSLDIKLPTTPSTRATNDNYNDGKPVEYAVHDCALLLFQGSNEEDAQLINAQAVLLPSKETNPDLGITTTHTAVASVDGYSFSSSNNLYALAILNYKNVMSIDGDGVPSFLDENGSFKPVKVINKEKNQEGAKIADIRKLQTVANLTTRGGTQDYFFMTNAVLSKDQGGANNQSKAPTSLFQLAELDDTKIYQNMDDAENHPAGEIFVERAVAKATLDIDKDVKTVKTGGKVKQDGSQDEDETLDIDIDALRWTIDNMEPNTYVARNPGMEDESEELEEGYPYLGYASRHLTPSNFRFVGNTSMVTTVYGEDNFSVYRTYWCIDPHYNIDNDETATGNFMLPATSVDNNLGTDNPIYCYENTFDVPRQSFMNTTRAIIMVKLKGEEGSETSKFWTVNNVAGRFTKVEDAQTYVLDDIISNTDIVELFADYYSGEEPSYDILPADFKVTYGTINEDDQSINENERDEYNGQLKVAKIELSQDFIDNRASNFTKVTGKNFVNEFNALIANKEKDIIGTVNNNVIILQYEKGVMYYEARFQHFAGVPSEGTDLAPWNYNLKEEEEDKPGGGSTDAAYPGDDAAQNYLGRYGMVRNNWYDVTITSFNKLGSPVDPSGKVVGDGTPDDDINEYISAKIHVLAWAKRTQSWGF